MRRGEYLEVLERLPVLIDGRSEEWKKFFPHLPDITLKELVEKGQIACPGIFAKDTVLILRVDYENGLKQVNDIEIEINWAARMKNSGKPHYPYAEEALAFSNHNWESELVDPDDWCHVQRIFLQSPRDLQVADVALWVAVNIPLACGISSIEQDESAPVAELYDESIVHIIGSEVIAAELKADKNHNTCSRCSLCGYLLRAGCDGCGVDFKFPKHGISTSFVYDGCSCESGPMGPKLAAAFRGAGHFFMASPEKIAKAEKKEWLKKKKAMEKT